MMMKTWRNNLPKGKTIHILVLFALLLSLVSQNHLHLHDEDSHEHVSYELSHQEHSTLSHSADIHTSYDDSHSLTHSDTQIISLQPEGWVKYMNDDMYDLPPVVLLVLFLLMLSIFCGIQISEYKNKNRLTHRYYNLPVLRAPPAKP